jgi:exonuclease SbcC
MHVTRVELENIKSYEHADFHFEPGTTAIVGRNGAGKTTILEAIAWTLFDHLEYSKDDFLRRGAKKGLARVTFQSDLDKRQYTVYRDTGSGYYIVDTALAMRLAERKKDVTDFIHQHLGVEPGTDLRALFTSAVGVPQGTITSDFLKSSVQRKAAFDRLLKVEEYRDSAERLRATVSLINERIGDAKVRIAGAEGQLARYDEFVSERADVSNGESQLSRTLANIETRIAERATAVAALDHDEQKVGEARLAQERLAVALDGARRRLSDAEREAAAALSAVERQSATADDHARHTIVLDRLRELEAERTRRDELRFASDKAARVVLAAEMEARKAADALEGAECARDALAALGVEIETQIELERERERSRDIRSQMVGARDAAARLERDLQLLREQHKATSEKLKRAERGQGAQERLEDLDIERIGLENEIARMREAAMSYKHLAEQQRQLQTEIARLRKITTTLEADIATLTTHAALAAQMETIEQRAHASAERVAHLRAEIKRDERMQQEVEGGLCPILSERCLNIGEDQNLDSYFTVHLSANRLALRDAEHAHTKVNTAVAEARQAHAAVAGLARLQQNLTHERELLTTRETALRQVEAELARIERPSAAREQEIKNKLNGVTLAAIAARDEALLYAEAEPLRARLLEIAEEGKARRDEQAELLAAASGIEAIDEELAALETRLARLNDPRARAAALRRDAERETELRRISLTAAERLRDSQVDAARHTAALAEFAGLDENLRLAIAERDRTAAGYQAYLAAAALAATLPARQTLVADFTAEAARLDSEAARARDDYEFLAARYNRAAHNTARAELQAAREQHAATNQQLRHTREHLARLSADIARLDAIRNEMRAEFAEKDRLERLHATTDFVRETLKKAGPLVTESYLYNISIEANQLFREITGEAGRTLRWTRDYEVIMEEAGHERSFANLSGGEQMVAALSIRLALLKQLSDIRIAIFDEPTTNMDAERRERLAHAIGQVRHFDQLFVISHDDAFEEAADHRIHVGGIRDEGRAMKEGHSAAA